MGRPRVTEERANEILDAFEACVARRGLEGTTLQRIADQAGLARSLIRHHVGNWDQVLAAWVERAIDRYRDQLREFLDALPTTDRAKALAAYLFEGDQTEPDRVMDLVIATAADHDEPRRRIGEFVEEMIQTIADELKACYPHADDTHCLDVAGGLVALSMTTESLRPLRMRDEYLRTWASAGQRLVRALEIDDG